MRCTLKRENSTLKHYLSKDTNTIFSNWRITSTVKTLITSSCHNKEIKISLNPTKCCFRDACKVASRCPCCCFKTFGNVAPSPSWAATSIATPFSVRSQSRFFQAEESDLSWSTSTVWSSIKASPATSITRPSRPLFNLYSEANLSYKGDYLRLTCQLPRRYPTWLSASSI